MVVHFWYRSEPRTSSSGHSSPKQCSIFTWKCFEGAICRTDIDIYYVGTTQVMLGSGGSWTWDVNITTSHSLPSAGTSEHWFAYQHDPRVCQWRVECGAATPTLQINIELLQQVGIRHQGCPNSVDWSEELQQSYAIRIVAFNARKGIGFLMP